MKLIFAAVESLVVPQTSNVCLSKDLGTFKKTPRFRAFFNYNRPCSLQPKQPRQLKQANVLPLGGGEAWLRVYVGKNTRESGSR